VMRGNAISGYGIFARAPLAQGDTVFRGEGREQRIITARRVAETWSDEDKLTFRRYGYPLSSDVYALWSDDPGTWAPQNHSCEPNCEFDGLDTVTVRDVAAGEELTLDYAAFMNAESEPFQCHCGAVSCRGTIHGTAGNSVSSRERVFRSEG
ncbi:MAG: SET domain-containing protein-lysine N-methyltransferase, partial [Gemmatimonas sp.]